MTVVAVAVARWAVEAMARAEWARPVAEAKARVGSGAEVAVS